MGQQKVTRIRTEKKQASKYGFFCAGIFMFHFLKLDLRTSDLREKLSSLEKGYLRAFISTGS